jgi:hypothetical protein
MMKKRLIEFDFDLYHNSDKQFIQSQAGVFRTNCLDCLDRTNVVQTLFARDHLNNLIVHFGLRLGSTEQSCLMNLFNNLWADVSFV